MGKELKCDHCPKVIDFLSVPTPVFKEVFDYQTRFDLIKHMRTDYYEKAIESCGMIFTITKQAVNDAQDKNPGSSVNHLLKDMAAIIWTMTEARPDLRHMWIHSGIRGIILSQSETVQQFPELYQFAKRWKLTRGYYYEFPFLAIDAGSTGALRLLVHQLARSWEHVASWADDLESFKATRSSKAWQAKLASIYGDAASAIKLSSVVSPEEYFAYATEAWITGARDLYEDVTSLESMSPAGLQYQGKDSLSKHDPAMAGLMQELWGSVSVNLYNNPKDGKPECTAAKDLKLSGKCKTKLDRLKAEVAKLAPPLPKPLKPDLPKVAAAADAASKCGSGKPPPTDETLRSVAIAAAQKSIGKGGSEAQAHDAGKKAAEKACGTQDQAIKAASAAAAHLWRKARHQQDDQWLGQQGTNG